MMARHGKILWLEHQQNPEDIQFFIFLYYFNFHKFKEEALRKYGHIENLAQLENTTHFPVKISFKLATDAEVYMMLLLEAIKA